ncbi:Hypothetical predicted protein [Xyrichtys novacula]|uniref:Uncharacterized protein n=1 Tax=Xyrichtys novacula TaxID=13765 RepID=A0AAV1GTL3_XYRNO|nr:Hypothetical predicted protein [Xyrichtys novacula]
MFYQKYCRHASTRGFDYPDALFRSNQKYLQTRHAHWCSKSLMWPEGERRGKRKGERREERGGEPEEKNMRNRGKTRKTGAVKLERQAGINLAGYVHINTLIIGGVGGVCGTR